MTKRTKDPAERALRKFLPLLFTALAVQINRIVPSLLCLAFAYFYLYVNEEGES